MAHYVDAFVIPLSKKHLNAYRLTEAERHDG